VTSNVFASASEWLGRMRSAHAGTSVTYRRGSDAVEITAQKLVVDVEVDRGDGLVTISQRVDWVIQAADLVLGATPATPVEGDTIEEVLDGGARLTYEVMPYGTDLHYRPLGTSGDSWRVFSRLIAEA